MGQRSATKSVVAVMAAFVERPTWTQADLARATGLQRPEALRNILRELQESGMRLESEKSHPHVYWRVAKGWHPAGVLFKTDAVPDLLRQLLRLPQSKARDKLLAIVREQLPARGKLTPAAPVVSRPLSESEEEYLPTVEEAAATKLPMFMKYLTASRGGVPSDRYVSIHVIDVGPPARFIATCHKNGEPPSPDRSYQARTLWLSSARLGITAKVDVVEGDADGNVIPIEYKRGKVPDLPEGAYLPERAQVCAQVLLLREHGYRCDHGDIYFAGSRKRVTIAIDDTLVAMTLDAVARARALTETSEAPPPLVDSPKCNGCSLVAICLPDEVNILRGLERGQIEEAAAAVDPAPDAIALVEDPSGDPWDLGTDPEPPRHLRRLHPASDEKLPLYVQDQGARIGLDGDCLVVRGRQGPSVTARLSASCSIQFA